MKVKLKYITTEEFLEKIKNEEMRKKIKEAYPRKLYFYTEGGKNNA